ncbi:MAG: hypothetical protein BJ554DRAFT_7875 [Olpidium bornovanus]|uniref:arginine--tRNA ligase n=1 Tax=Olpidium bornovanus TaxID=278681 RepID=A0A8H8DIY0_9FUNG|nr:MAG: hypothetical protein BJ554DRAFT_7875 [Olpidium bornovanus]
MELLFSASAPPYAHVAVYACCASAPGPQKPLKLTVAPASVDTSLLRPGAKGPAPTGVNILRFFAREASATSGTELYDETAGSTAGPLVDEVLEAVRLANRDAARLDDLVALLDRLLAASPSKPHPAFLAGTPARTIADFAAWAVLRAKKDRKQFSPNINTWMEIVEALPEAKHAVEVVDARLAEAAKECPGGGGAGDASASVSELPGTEPHTNMHDFYRNMIASEMSRLTEVPAEKIIDMIDIPKGNDLGDYAMAVPKLRLSGNPIQLAKEFSEKVIAVVCWAPTLCRHSPSFLRGGPPCLLSNAYRLFNTFCIPQFACNEYITNTNCKGPFINFVTAQDKRIELVLRKLIGTMREKYGSNSSGKGKRIIVEFSSPNIAKPFHAGHLRSTIIGNFVKNIHVASGWTAIAMNYLGDWGKQYGLLAVGYKRFGSEEELAADPIKHLFDVYVKINAEAETDPSIHDEARAYFKQMEDGDAESLKLWSRFRDLSIEKYKKIYARLGVEFDVYSGESQVTDAMYRAIKILRDKDLLIPSEGAEIIDLTEYKMGKAIVQKSDGTTLYITRDIGAAMERHERYKFDKMIYVVASQQDLHLKQLFKILELAGFPFATSCLHVNHGMVLGMAPRRGNVVFLEDMLDNAGETMHEVMKGNPDKYAQIQFPEVVADCVGITAIIVQDMQARRIKNYSFDWKRMLSFEGDTGPYLQYAHARLCSVERTFVEQNGFAPNVMEADLSLLTEKATLALVSVLADWPDVVRAAQSNLEPCTVCTYAFRVSHQVSVAWESIWVANQPRELAHARACLYQAACVTLGNAMRMIGLKPLQRM